MRNNYLYLFLVFTLLFGVSSCNDDDPTPIPQVTVSVTLNAPDSVSNAVVSNVVATLKNITTGRASEIDVIPAETGASTSFNFTLTVEEGLYNMTLEGDITYAFHDQQITSKIRGYKGNVQLTGTNPSISLEGFLHNNTVGEKGNFVLAEIFFTGTETPEKKQYTGDKYFRIYNNSSDTLYADRLMIAESEFTTVKKYNYDPDIMNLQTLTSWMLIIRMYPIWTNTIVIQLRSGDLITGDLNLTYLPEYRKGLTKILI